MPEEIRPPVQSSNFERERRKKSGAPNLDSRAVLSAPLDASAMGQARCISVSQTQKGYVFKSSGTFPPFSG